MTLATPTPPWGPYRPELWDARGSGQTAVGVLWEALDGDPVSEAGSHAPHSVWEPRAGSVSTPGAWLCGGGGGGPGGAGQVSGFPGRGPPACLPASHLSSTARTDACSGNSFCPGAASGRDTKPQAGRGLLGAGRAPWRGVRQARTLGPPSAAPCSLLGPALVTAPGGLFSGLRRVRKGYGRHLGWLSTPLRP